MRFTPVSLAELLRLPPPTEQQAAIISAPLEPMLVVAGAGSGKTETMAARVLWLIANDLVRPEQVLGLTFTRKAAGELGARIRRRLGQLEAQVGPDDKFAGEPTISTYDAYAGRIHAEHGLRGGYEPSTRLITEAERWRFADSVVRAYDGDMSEIDKSPGAVTEAVLRLAGDLAGQLRTPEDLALFQARLPPLRGRTAESTQRARAQLVPLIRSYQNKLEAAEVMAFGDQLSRSALIARDHPEVRAAERGRFTVVLLDEYQDTSHGQFVLLQALFGDGYPVTAVGDPAQAIYGWRGASAGSLERFLDSFGGTRKELSVSWRNQPGILTAANALSAGLESKAVLRAGRPDHGRPAVRCALHLTADAEADWIADRLDRALRSYWEDDARPTAAVLVRKRSQMARIEAALRARGLPVEVVGLGGLLDTPEVVEVLSTLRVLADPTAGGALLRLLTGPRWRIGPRDVMRLYRWSRDLGEESSIIEALDSLADEAEPLDEPESSRPDFSAEGARRLGDFARELRALRSHLDRSLPDLVADVITTIGLDVEVITRPATDGMVHLAEFGDVAARFAAESRGPGLGAFLSYLDAAAREERGLEQGPAQVADNAVQLVTVHSAKGLEWDVVAVAGLNDGLFPDPAGKADAWLQGLGVLPFPLRGDAAELPEFTGTIKDFDAAWKAHGEREERRLAYVAVTRARDLLLCSGYRWSDNKRPSQPSPFLTEIRAHADTDVWVDDPGPENPLRAVRQHKPWPHDPLSADRRRALSAGADLVRSFLGTPCELSEEVSLLLAERDGTADDSGAVALPDRLTVSQLVTLARDPAELARRLRRPLPERPATHARRGTAFHSWLERRNGAETLLDLHELPGAADADAAPDADFADLRAAFEAGSWADRVPYRIEVPFSTLVGGVLLRGRMDAVFRDGDTYDVVDWKTGRPPSGEAARAAAVQLAAYRLAWAELVGVPLDRVRAAFHYVREDRTVRPVDLLDAEGLAALVAGVPLRSGGTLGES
ncbi:ATP-dependent DNA helicase [Longispora fulva]|uniref:UvrD-helicase domain-containing protein n=1 Tax=Longispora fulva TaxID=619741 RepID=UPI001A3EA59C|nr:UvrD-helicase domain-containing protein [Longispora fulva]GIG58269.1 ATP-dependent DNA helicase [Longispora fulva]